MVLGSGELGWGSFGRGVEVRLPAHGLMESTAEARYDFSALRSAVPEAMDPV